MDKLSDALFTLVDDSQAQFYRMTGVADVNNTTNTTNSSNTPNTTNSSNSTNTTNSSNSTNTTSPSNVTNNTALTNITDSTINPNLSSNSTNNNVVVQPFYQNSFVTDDNFKTYQETLSTILQNDALLFLNMIPGSRKIIKPVFSFFINFDDIWLYIYHPREYNKVVNTFFAMNEALESEKYKLLPFSKLWSFLGINTIDLVNFLDYKRDYTPAKFV